LRCYFGQRLRPFAHRKRYSLLPVSRPCNFLADEIKLLKLHFFACSILVHLGRTAVQTAVQLLPASKKLQKLDAKLQMACK